MGDIESPFRMAERRIPLRVLRVELPCPIKNCPGEMRDIGFTLTSCPPLFVHRCTKCGHEEELPKSYPAIEYEEEEYVPIFR